MDVFALMVLKWGNATQQQQQSPTNQWCCVSLPLLPPLTDCRLLTAGRNCTVVGSSLGFHLTGVVFHIQQPALTSLATRATLVLPSCCRTRLTHRTSRLRWKFWHHVKSSGAVCCVGESQIINVRANLIVGGFPCMCQCPIAERNDNVPWREKMLQSFFFFLDVFCGEQAATAGTQILIKNKWEILGFASAPLMVLSVDVCFLAFHGLKLQWPLYSSSGC